MITPSLKSHQFASEVAKPTTTTAGAEMARAELRNRRLAWNKGRLMPLPSAGESR